MTRKNFYIKTFGCQMNIYDSSKIFDLMLSSGYSCVSDLQDADVIILNTCYIREKAAEKIFSELGRIKIALQKSQKKISRGRENGRPIFIITGCVAKAEGENIFRRVPYVDAVLSPSEYYSIPEVVKSLRANPDEKISKLDLTGTKKFDYLVDVKSGSNDCSAFVAVQEGCDNFCTYCVVPNTRGREVSRSFKSVIDEVRALDNGKVAEVTLLGQNVSSYNGVDEDGAQKNLADLIREIDALDFVKRIRYITSYPTKLGDELVALHASSKKMMPLLFVPIQSGSDAVLKKMNRKYTSAQYLNMIDDVLSRVPNAKFSSDFIVGFPTESDEDFNDTLRIAERIGFVNSFSFKYSARPGTVAAKMDGQVDDEIASARLIELQDLLQKNQLKFNRSMTGKTVDVLIESVAHSSDKLMFGKTEYLQTVLCDYDAKCIGKIMPVKIVKADAFTLFGEVAV